MCEYMDLEATQENKEVLKNLKNGECLFQDLDRHIEYCVLMPISKIHRSLFYHSEGEGAGRGTGSRTDRSDGDRRKQAVGEKSGRKSNGNNGG